MSFLRFVATTRQQPYGASTGPFLLALEMTEDSEQPVYYRRPLREHLDWFNANLPAPDKFHLRLSQTSTGIGVCWFKDGAAEHISRMREMCFVLVEIGYPIDFRWAAQPGRLVYEDVFQIVALDHKRTVHEYWN